MNTVFLGVKYSSKQLVLDFGFLDDNSIELIGAFSFIQLLMIRLSDTIPTFEFYFNPYLKWTKTCVFYKYVTKDDLFKFWFLLNEHFNHKDESLEARLGEIILEVDIFDGDTSTKALSSSFLSCSPCC